MSARLRGTARRAEEIVAAEAHRSSDGRTVAIAAAVGAVRAAARSRGYPHPGRRGCAP